MASQPKENEEQQHPSLERENDPAGPPEPGQALRGSIDPLDGLLRVGLGLEGYPHEEPKPSQPTPMGMTSNSTHAGAPSRTAMLTASRIVKMPSPVS